MGRPSPRSSSGVIEADIHSLTVHLAGTFTPTPELGDLAQQASDLGDAIFDRAVAAGAVRDDLVTEDVAMIFEQVTAVRVDDPERTRVLRARYLALLLDAVRPGARTRRPARTRTDRRRARCEVDPALSVGGRRYRRHAPSLRSPSWTSSTGRSSASRRPAPSCAGQLEFSWWELGQRLETVTQDEFLWEPGPGALSVRRRGESTAPRAFGVGEWVVEWPASGRTTRAPDRSRGSSRT